MHDHSARIAAELNLSPARVAAAIALIDEGNTIPFIARYRKMCIRDRCATVYSAAAGFSR